MLAINNFTVNINAGKKILRISYFWKLLHSPLDLDSANKGYLFASARSLFVYVP
jgi:hypothetical protein